MVECLSAAEDTKAKQGRDDSPGPDNLPENNEDEGLYLAVPGAPNQEVASDCVAKKKKKRRKTKKIPGVSEPFIVYPRFEEFRELEDSFQFPHHTRYTLTKDDKALVPRFEKKRLLLGSYHEDFQRDFHPSMGPLRVLRKDFDFTPQCEKDFTDTYLPLNKQQKTYQKYLGTPRSTLQNLLYWMAQNIPILDDLRSARELGKKARKSFRTEECQRIRMEHVDFVCSKTVLCRLVEAIHLFGGRIKIYATKFDGTIYILGTELKKNQKAKISAWSHRFRDWLCDPDFDLEESPTSTNSVCRTVFSSYVGNYRVIYTVCTDAMLPDDAKDYADEGEEDYSEHEEAFSAYKDFEVDAKNFDPDKDLSRYAHIRCMQTCKKSTQLEKYKFLYWTHDSIFSSVRNVIAGQRSPRGVLSSVTRYTRKHYSSVAAESWQVEKGFVFLKKFLHFVQEQFSKVQEKEILLFERVRGESVVYCRKPKLDEEKFGGADISGNVEYSDHAIHILPGFWTRRKDRRLRIENTEGF